ncbi:MAG TPA: glycosyltransferase family 2 protein [Vicinamibacterales bacterium]|nr:glycosyltransferase family 2 protein [Vicinamibacterales bacterium]
MTPRIDVVIVSFNTREDLARCLASLAAARAGPVAHIVVVDNASTDGTPAMVQADFPAVDLTALDTNVGFGAANNVGIRRATSPLVLLLNPDTVVPAGAIERMAARLEATGAVALGPRLVDTDGRPEVSFGPMLSPSGEARQWLRQRLARSSARLARRHVARLLGRERTVDWVTAACCLVRREAVVDAGLFDERFFMYEEDVDLCAALRARGGRILFSPVAEVIHARGRSTSAMAGAGRAHYDRSHRLFYEKHRPRWAGLLRRWKQARGRDVP